jgi:hypothetical protein
VRHRFAQPSRSVYRPRSGASASVGVSLVFTDPKPRDAAADFHRRRRRIRAGECADPDSVRGLAEAVALADHGTGACGAILS